MLLYFFTALSKLKYLKVSLVVTDMHSETQDPRFDPVTRQVQR